jgi:chromosomal replication initiator protein
MTIKERIEELQLLIDNSLIEIEILNNVLKDSHEDNIKFILDTVSIGENIPIQEIKSKSRKEEVVIARIMCASLLKNFTTLTLRQIGIELGFRHHASILHCIKSLNNFLEIKDFRVKDYRSYEKRIENRQNSITHAQRRITGKINE